VFRVERGDGTAFRVASFFAPFVFGILATMVAVWFSCWREFGADKGSASLAGRQNMIDALRRLQAAQVTPKMPDELAAFAISAGGVQALFANQPPLEKRIAALAGGD